MVIKSISYKIKEVLQKNYPDYYVESWVGCPTIYKKGWFFGNEVAWIDPFDNTLFTSNANAVPMLEEILKKAGLADSVDIYLYA